MPDTLSLSTGVSLGLLAGIVSGVCYLFANGFTASKCERDSRPSIASSSNEGICRRCGGESQGIPCICVYKEPVKFESGAWFLRQVQRALSLMPWSISSEKLEQIEEEREGSESPSEPARELRNVRQFLEALSAKLAGGPLEGTRVAPLYHHPAYESMFDHHHADLSKSLSSLVIALRDAFRNLPPQPSASSGQSISAHAQLKRLVARVVEEAAALPALARYAAEPTTPTVDGSTYEDLLATAILNKVIERYQTENGSGGRSSGIHSVSASPTPSERSSPRSLNSRHRNISPALPEEDDVSDWEEGEATASDEAIETPKRVPFPEFGGDIVHNAIDNEEQDFDDVSSSDIQAVDGSWEENWLFQKKKIKTIQSVPVPMLVPNSNTEYRALIGDRDAEDTTDLSDNASDVEGETEYKSDIKRVLDLKHVIGGKSKVDEILDYEPDSLTVTADFDEEEEEEEKVIDAVNNEINEAKNQINNTSTNLHNGHNSMLILGVDSGPLPKAEFALKEEIHRTLMNGNLEEYAESDTKMNGYGKDVVDGFNSNTGSTNTLSQHEREGEYEETVTVPVQRYADSLRRKHFEDEQILTRDNDKEDHLRPGTVAYRERKKWLNCVEMPNNPYSPEAIQKRLLAKSTSSLFDNLTSKNKEFEDDTSIKSEIVSKREGIKRQSAVNEEPNHYGSIDLGMENIEINGTRSKSSSPKILRDVLAEEVPQYKRYGRDYYIREAKKSSGGRNKSISNTSSLSLMNKSTSLDNFDRELTSPVSASSSLSDLEASALHQNIVRAVLSPRNASPNFAINPIFEYPDRQNDNADENHAKNTRVDANVRERNRSVCDGGDGYVENEDIVRLKIPKVPEITEDLFESYTDVRRSNTMRSEDLCLRSKKRPALNYTFGGSLRLNKGFRTDLCNPQKTLVGILIKQINNIASNQHYTKFAGNDQILRPTTLTSNNNKSEVLIEYEDVNEHKLFSAKPAYVDDDTDKRFEEILQSAYNNTTVNDTERLHEPTSPNLDTSYVSTSSLEDSIKIYNVPTGEIVKSTASVDKLSKYEQTPDCNDNIDLSDKNISGTDDKLSQNGDASEESLVNLEIVYNSDSLTGEIRELEDILPQLPNVKELAKKFVSMENLTEHVQPLPQPIKQRKKSNDNLLNSDPSARVEKLKPVYMHSLTARSISKQFREELKLSMATPLTVPGGTKEIPEGEEVIKESSRPNSPLPEPGTLKTKLAFFESLKNRFSSK